MNGERRELYYDVEADSAFRDAVIDILIAPAYMAALSGTHETDSSVAVDSESEYDDSREVHDFFAEKGSDCVTIGVSSFVGSGELSEEALILLRDEIQDSDLAQEYKNQFAEPQAVAAARVELYTRYEYLIDLADATIVVRTTIGFSIDGQEIHSNVEQEAPIPELDQERSNIFEVPEIIMLVRALYAMELISQDDVRRFLEAF